MTGALRQAILAAVDAIEASREALCALDAPTGDGDHGVTMTIGARNVRRQLAAVDGDEGAALARAAARGMAAAGGAIGPIYGRALEAVAVELDAESHTGGPGLLTADEVGLLRRCAGAGVRAIEALGGAGAGDKTILDALLPVAAALEEAEREGRSLAEALEAAASAARAGAEATADMVARVGRSARFGERSRGSPDPGATSFAIVIDALASSALGTPVSGGREPVS